MSYYDDNDGLLNSDGGGRFDSRNDREYASDQGYRAAFTPSQATTPSRQPMRRRPPTSSLIGGGRRGELSSPRRNSAN